MDRSPGGRESSLAWQAVVVLPQSYRVATLIVISWDRGIAITLAPDETCMRTAFLSLSWPNS